LSAAPINFGAALLFWGGGVGGCPCFSAGLVLVNLGGEPGQGRTSARARTPAGGRGIRYRRLEPTTI